MISCVLKEEHKRKEQAGKASSKTVGKAVVIARKAKQVVAKYLKLSLYSQE